jgi:hypothetical protein
MKKVSYPKLILNLFKDILFVLGFYVVLTITMVLYFAVMLLALIVYPWDKGYFAIYNALSKLGEILHK